MVRLPPFFQREILPFEETPLVSYPIRCEHEVHVELHAESLTGLKGLSRQMECALLMHLNSPSKKASGDPTNHRDDFSKFGQGVTPRIHRTFSSPSVPIRGTWSSLDTADRYEPQFMSVQVSDFALRDGHITPSEYTDKENMPLIRPPSFSRNANILMETPPKPWKKKERHQIISYDASTLLMAQILSETKKESGKWQHEASRSNPMDPLSLELDLSPISLPECVLMPLPIATKPKKKVKALSKLKFGKLVSGPNTSYASNFSATGSSSSRPRSALPRSLSQNSNRPEVPDSMRASSRFMNRVCVAHPSFVPDDPVYIRNTDPNTVFKNLVRIGSGGSGTVFKATKSDGQTVAIKIVGPENCEESDALEMEIRMMNCTRHPNLIKCYETYEHAGSLWIVMELMEGGNLTAVLKKLHSAKKRMPEREIAFIIREVLKGLQFMHTLKRMHRDIKSDNILLTEDGRVKLADFGFCAQLTDNETHRNSVVGTPYWMAPELLCDDGYDYHVDIWSVGILAIECAQWIPPLMEHAPMKALEIICTNEPPKLDDPAGIWTQEFHEFVKSALMKNPKERPTAETMLEHAFLQKTTGRAVSI